jgi:membrane protein DedA with SNARE-associated domain
MPYPRFLAFNAVGGIVWGVAVVMIGYLAGNSYATVEKTFGQAAALIVLAVVLVGIGVWWVRRHRKQA